jgi:hypothetical protein
LEKERMLERQQILKTKNIHTEYDPKTHNLILVSTQQHTKPMSFFTCAKAEDDKVTQIGFSSLSSERLSITANKMTDINKTADPMVKLKEEIAAIQERMEVINNLIKEVDNQI